MLSSRSPHKKSKKSVVFTLIFLFVLIPLVALNSYLIGTILRMTIQYIGVQTGSIRDTNFISGTGSMYPTFPKGKGKTTIEQITETVGDVKTRTYPGGFTFMGKSYFQYTIVRGDIVFFANAHTKEIIEKESSGSASETTGFVKRVIAVGGDRIRINDGFVYINDTFIDEPYIASPRSTFGGSYLPDCKTMSIPPGFVFVMGDNRKESNDSRFDVELVALSEITHVIPLADQENLKANWRDTKHDRDTALLPTLDITKYVDALNEIRRDEGRKPLKLNEKLSNSALLRAKSIIKFNDISFEATISGYSMKQSMRDSGYNNIVWGEAPTFGYYTEKELIDNSVAFPSTKEFLLNPEFQDVGIAAVVGSVNNCPTQLIVQQFGGYRAPNYTSEIVNGWKTLLTNLEEIEPSWIKIRTIGSFYDKHKNDIERVITIIHIRIDRIRTIVKRMENREWLTATEESYANEDKALYDEQERIATELNNAKD